MRHSTRTIGLLVVLALLAFVTTATASPFGGDIGIGMTAVTEEQSAADYGWTGTVSSNFEVFSFEFSTRAIGSITYPAYDHHPVESIALIQTAMFRMDSEMGMEFGGGMKYTEEWNPVLYYGWNFELPSGHDFRPFVMFTMNDRETAQAGFLATFGW